MKTLNLLLDKARANCERDSDRSLAQTLKVTGQTVMQWRKGVNRITDEHLHALIAIAKEDPAILLKIREEMAGNPTERRQWRTLLDRMGAAAVVVAVGAAVIALAHPGAHEALQAGLPLFAVNLPSIHYAKLRVTQAMARLRWIWLWIKTCLPTRRPADKEIAACCPDCGPAGGWPAATWWRPRENASPSAGCVDCSGVLRPLTSGTRPAPGILPEKRVSNRW